MPKFLIEATRHHVEIESASFTVEAETANTALALAKSMEQQGDIEDEWYEEDRGYDDPDSYTWTVTPEE
jgi:hypothetical protein